MQLSGSKLYLNNCIQISYNNTFGYIHTQFYHTVMYHLKIQYNLPPMYEICDFMYVDDSIIK